MKYSLHFVLPAALVASICTPLSADEPTHRKLSAIPFTDVKVDDAFWAPRLKTNREVSLPHNFKWCEETGRFSNFAKAAGEAEGKFEGIFFNDSDVYKVLEGASYSLADHPDPVLDRMTDDVIAKIAAAQHENGYLNTYYTLVEPDKKWTNCRVRHELYCAGHLIEAAVAHHLATGKRTLLDVALRFTDRIDELFGPEARHDVPGHEEIELALVKLYQLTDEKRYMDLAQFFLDVRGDQSKRETLYGEYCQDHLPISQQSEIVGHAVRAMYLYAGVADVAAYTGNQPYVDAMARLWQDVVGRKMYLTGGIGARHSGESFGEPFELPNDSAYAETCAAIGLALWSHRLNLMHGDAHYADVLETVLYNGILSGIGADGEHFFYVNPLTSNGGHHRQPFFPCACCPTNVVRFVPSVPGYVYARGKAGIFVNLYIAGVGKIVTSAGTPIEITQETGYPFDGRVRLTFDVPKKRTGWIQVNLRIPAWCEEARLSLNGKSIDPIRMVNGYAQICRYWDPGDVIELDLPMEIQRIEANPRVEADRGRVAIRRGPIVYCFEACDNGGRVRNIVLARDPEFTAEHDPNTLGGVTVITGTALGDRQVIAVPYYAWDHREPGEMAVWVRQDGKTRSPEVDDPSWEKKLYRPLDPATLGPSEPIAPIELVYATASHAQAGVGALNDRREPKNSCDHDIPRFTWWNHKGTVEWVQYEFDEPVKLSAVEVYWFDDERINRHCRAPESWKLLYKQGDTWKPVASPSDFGAEIDRYNRTTFDPIETSALRIEVQLQGPWSGGILEWKVE